MRRLVQCVVGDSRIMIRWQLAACPLSFTHIALEGREHPRCAVELFKDRNPAANAASPGLETRQRSFVCLVSLDATQ